MTTEKKEKASKVGLAIMTLILAALLAGILGYEPYMKNHEKQIEKIIDQIEGENNNGEE